jgi:hypothetical protein
VKVIQHIPSSFEGFEPENHEVKNERELLALPFIARWKENPKFHCFSLDRNYWPPKGTLGEPVHLLMAEFDQGYEWWVVAKLTGEDGLEFAGLPDWHTRYRTSG